ncbi:MAG: sodium-dependent transporter [Oscillospiraceae bacterium]|nr:sodium-dependent transporter [Oscillospiraceae bacterium]
MKTKSGFSTRVGFVLAAAGSAVGLGNLWRFPYLAAKYGGGIFLLVYLILAITFGFTLMLTEIAIGRKTGKSCIDAFGVLNKKCSFIGYIVAIVPIIIFPYYSVIGGWVTKFVTLFVSGKGSEAASDEYFGGFIGQVGEPLFYLAIFIGITAVIIMFGVQKGIENVSKFLMPVLAVMTVGIGIYSLTLPGAMDGFIYYVKPNFDEFSIKTVVAAMGQLFYSMSLAMGIMITYGSYMSKKNNLEKSVRQIEIFDTGIAFMAGVMIIPAVFSFSNGDPNMLEKGPTLMFVILPKVFNSMAGGQIFGAAFFILVFLAALTSAVSLMETILSVLMDKFNIGRIPGCLLILFASFLIAIPSSLGFGIWSDITIFGMSFLDFFDYISNNILMPVAGLLTCLFIGYIVKPKTVEEEIRLSGPFKGKALYNVMVKYVAPVFMVVILVSSVIGYV